MSPLESHSNLLPSSTQSISTVFSPSSPYLPHSLPLFLYLPPLFLYLLSLSLSFLPSRIHRHPLVTSFTGPIPPPQPPKARAGPIFCSVHEHCPAAERQRWGERGKGRVDRGTDAVTQSAYRRVRFCCCFCLPLRFGCGVTVVCGGQWPLVNHWRILRTSRHPSPLIPRLSPPLDSSPSAEECQLWRDGNARQNTARGKTPGCRLSGHLVCKPET